MARGSSGQQAKILLGYMGWEFVECQKSMHERKREKCRKGGTQKPCFDRLAVMFFEHCRDDQKFSTAALDRSYWGSCEEAFVKFGREHL